MNANELPAEQNKELQNRFTAHVAPPVETSAQRQVCRVPEEVLGDLRVGVEVGQREFDAEETPDVLERLLPRAHALRLQLAQHSHYTSEHYQRYCTIHIAVSENMIKKNKDD